jgi:hypothetical protein
MDGCTMVGAGYTKLAIAQRDLLARHFSSGPVLGERNCRATPHVASHRILPNRARSDHASVRRARTTSSANCRI